jgi:hypothetical protein
VKRKTRNFPLRPRYTKPLSAINIKKGDQGHFGDYMPRI